MEYITDEAKFLPLPPFHLHLEPSNSSSIMLHQSGVIVYNNSYLWLNLVYVVALACYCGLCWKKIYQLHNYLFITSHNPQ